MINLKCYHMTEYKFLNSILSEGLKPVFGNRSKSVEFDKVRLYFSVEKASAIAIYCMMKYKYESKMKNTYASFEEYIGEGPFLEFEIDSIPEDMKYYDASIDYTIEPSRLSLVYLENEKGSKIFDKNEIVRYFINYITLEEIKELVFPYLNDEELEKSKIWKVITNFYNENILNSKNMHKNYSLKETKLENILNTNSTKERAFR